MNRASPALLALATLLAAPSAVAFNTYLPYVPNSATYNCGTCHVADNVGGARNAFGTAFAAAKNTNGLPSAWQHLWDLDSDGDGQTNGQELGDPCGVWSYVAALPPSRTVDISRPGDETSLSPAPNEPDADGDGVSDACDICPGYDDKEDLDGDGVPDACDDDKDGDGYTVAQGDCDDRNAARYPGAPEICNGIDDNCSALVDDADQPSWMRRSGTSTPTETPTGPTARA
jgi:hypothetical protein